MALDPPLAGLIDSSRPALLAHQQMLLDQGDVRFGQPVQGVFEIVSVMRRARWAFPAQLM